MSFHRSLRRIDEGSVNALTELADLELGIAEYPGLLSPTQCDSILKALNRTELTVYNPANYITTASRFGPSINDHRSLGSLADEYWRDVRESTSHWQDLGLDFHTPILDSIRAIWREGVVRPARIGGSEVGWGILRRMNSGTLIHWDDLRLEMPGLLDDEVVAQLSLNVHVTTPTVGGELSVWSRQRSADDEMLRESYGYRRSDAFPGDPDSVIHPTAGTGVFFCPQNYHAVSPVAEGDRLAVSLFMGICTSGELVLWA